jgi:alpha-tubulin suppressor-like RCC1 family protein
MSDKTVRCWGLNTDGQLGDGSYINRNRPVPVLQSAGIPLQNATWVTSGSRHSCATLGTGKVVCWGRDDAGQLGDGSFVDTTMAVSVFGLTNVTDLDTGGFHTCAVSNSTLQCWGKNAYKTISTAAQSYFNTPTLVGVPEPAKVGLGYQHSCASDVSGNVWCLGYNFNGELGDNTQDDKYAPDKVQQCSPAGPLTSVSSLAAGARHMCAIKTDKSVWCWGDSTDGQAGNGTASQNLCAVPVSVLTSAEKIVAGTNHVCAIASNQDLYCWGDNSVGQMGDSSTNDVTTPKVVMSNVVEVGAGGGHTCAILADGTMKCWGENLHGQLGQGVDSQKALPGDVKW